MFAEVLFVDDSERSLGIFKKAMKRSGIHSLYALNAHEAMKLLKLNTSLKVVFLDIMMPDIDGFTLAQMISKTFSNRDIKICYISALNDVKNVKKAINTGVLDYIVKPIDIAIITDKVNSLLKLEKNKEEFFKKKVSIGVDLSKSPLILELNISQIWEKGGVIISSVDFKIGSMFYVKSRYLSKIISKPNKEFRLLVRGSIQERNTFIISFEFLGLSYSEVGALRSMIIT